MDSNINLYRRNGKSVYIKMPEFNELAYVKELWSDKKNIGDTGEVYSFSRDKWEMFYKKMVYPTDGKNFYCLVYNLEDEPIGEVSFHGYNSATKVARINLKIHYNFRRKGYGKEALRLLLEYYFLQFGGQAIIDTVQSEEAKFLMKKLGFEAINSYKSHWTFKLTKKTFLAGNLNSKKVVAILDYNDSNIIERDLPFEIFSKANAILKEEYFSFYYLSIKDIENNLEIKKIRPNILFIPGGKGINKVLDNKEVLLYISEVYKECDYITSFSNGLHLFKDLSNIEGIMIPKAKWKIENTIETNKSFVDNGKIMISSNLIGHIELCLCIIKKALGDDISKEVAKEIGYCVDK